ncbi:hypothetical protein ACFZCU_43475 [Streptomyces canus]|uniref:hypothetical protein n=1 Tax=Streptomyces canus TaxID=58343 RepID=UPI0036E9BE06
MTIPLPAGRPDDIGQLCTPGTEPEVIALLLEEYKVLRAGFAQRVAVRVHLLGFVGILVAVLAAASGFRLDSPNLYVGLGVSGLGLWAWRTTNGAAQRLGAHLHDVEQRLNELAAQAYGTPVPLLRWEGVRQRRRADDPRLVQLLRRIIG